MISLLATIGLAVWVVGILGPAAAGVLNSCRARNLTQGTPSRSNLQGVITAASPGDRIAVKFVCVGNFHIAKRLTLVGQPTPHLPRAVLHANGRGRVLVVSARVTLTNLRITGGHVAYYGGGIRNTGILTLKSTVVSGNTASYAGGIRNTGKLTLDGSSSVSGNTADFAGGIYNDGGTLTLNDSSSVSGNTASPDSGGIYNTGTLTLKDSSSVSGNTASGAGGGIVSDGTVNGCDSSGVDEWIGTVEPNTPNDFLDSDVTLITCT
jgi:hypothetical protein